MSSISAEDIKRQILETENKSDVIRKIVQALPGRPEGETIEIGNDLEALTKIKGWSHVEAFMFNHMDITGLIFSNQDSSIQKGIARGYVDLMQYIKVRIDAKNKIIEKQKGTTTDSKGEK